jgi:hypothetical protein
MFRNRQTKKQPTQAPPARDTNSSPATLIWVGSHSTPISIPAK